MKIYLSGKITGEETQAHKTFAEKETELKAKGFNVINPMTLPHKHDKTWKSYMRDCIKALCDCDAILMLPGWENSKGAIIEHDVSIRLEITVFYKNVTQQNLKNYDTRTV